MSFQEATEPLLRPDQRDEMHTEKQRLEDVLNAPSYIANQISNRGELAKMLRRLSAQLEKQTPTAYPSNQVDDAVKREEWLREQILDGMPTQMEMRRNPAGAVDKNIAWEKRNKNYILERKNILRRLNPDSTEIDLCSVEKIRPKDDSAALNMHNEQIPGVTQFGPAPGSGPAVVFSEEDLALIGELSPELKAQIGLASNEQRRMVLDLLASNAKAVLTAEPAVDASDILDSHRVFIPTEALKPTSAASQAAPDAIPKVKAKRARRKSNMTPEARKAFGVKMKAARAAAQAAREAEGE